MATRKWKAPCNTCKGRFQHPCMFCGWKLETKKKVSEMNNSELAALNGLRNRRQFMMDLDASSTKAGNCATESQVIDKFLIEHRAWALGLLHRHENGEDSKIIAESEGLTQSFCEKLIRMTGDKLIRGSFALYVNPPVPTKPPVPLKKQKRVKIKWTEEEVEHGEPTR